MGKIMFGRSALSALAAAACVLGATALPAAAQAQTGLSITVGSGGYYGDRWDDRRWGDRRWDDRRWDGRWNNGWRGNDRWRWERERRWREEQRRRWLWQQRHRHGDWDGRRWDGYRGW